MPLSIWQRIWNRKKSQYPKEYLGFSYFKEKWVILFIILYGCLGRTTWIFSSRFMELIFPNMNSPCETIFTTGFIIVIGFVVAEISPAKGWRPFRHFGGKMRKKYPYSSILYENSCTINLLKISMAVIFCLIFLEIYVRKKINLQKYLKIYNLPFFCAAAAN